MYPCLDRIIEMEARLNRLTAVLESNPTLEELLLAQTDAVPLTEYMQGEWLCDYLADEQGMIPSDLTRGVLSQDALYNAVCDNDRLMLELLEANKVPLTDEQKELFAKWRSTVDISSASE